uniref:3-hydroxyacyl-CoA dehydrogenase family protein n=1 Tax=Desulfacinum infernum TaxID=35837 RepID=A0A832EKN3_9BACT
MRMGIVGFGKMGQAVWTVLRKAGFQVTTVMRGQDRAQAEKRRFLEKTERALQRQGLGEKERECRLQEMAESCRFTHRLEDLGDVDLVVENVVEDKVVKKNLFRALEEVVRPNAWLLTNTSSLSLDELAEGLRAPWRFCGLHFFYPTALIPLVEIIPSRHTETALVDSLKDFSLGLHRRPVVVCDGPGSVINGVLVHYYAEAIYMLEEGAAMPSAVDEAARDFFYVGPLESIDVIGLQLFLTGLRHAPPRWSAVPIRMPEGDVDGPAAEATGTRPGYSFPSLFRKLLNDARLGKSVGRGVFLYSSGKAQEDVPEYYRDPRRLGPTHGRSLDRASIARRLLWAVFNGCLWALHLKLAEPDALDVGVREVLQMERGPITWMRALGKKTVTSTFQDLERQEGPRFHVPVPEKVFG